MSIAIFVPLVVMVFLLVVTFRSTRRKKEELVAHAGLLLDSVELAERGQVRGKLAGRDVFVNLTSRGSGSSSVSWTEITAKHEPTPDLSLVLRPQTLAESAMLAISKGVDVRVGDDAFDRAYVVDAAPAAIIQRVLDDATLRETLVLLAPAELDDAGNALKISKKGWVEQTVMTRMLTTVTTLATRMEHFAKNSSTEPYRGGPPIDASRELEALKQARARRDRLRMTLVLALIFVFVSAFVLARLRG